MDVRSGNILRDRGLPGFHLVDEPGDPARRDLVSLRESACFYLAIEGSSAEGHQREDLLHAQHRPDVTARPVLCSFVDHSPSCPQLALMRAMMTTSILTPAQWSPNRFPRNSSGPSGRDRSTGCPPSGGPVTGGLDRPILWEVFLDSLPFGRVAGSALHAPATQETMRRLGVEPSHTCPFIVQFPSRLSGPSPLDHRRAQIGRRRIHL